MTFYEYLKSGEEYCEEQARRFAAKRDSDMEVFWTRAAGEYRARAEALTVEQAGLPYLEWGKA